MKDILCLLGLHDWKTKHYWYKDVNADIEKLEPDILGHWVKAICKKCGREKFLSYFDKDEMREQNVLKK